MKPRSSTHFGGLLRQTSRAALEALDAAELVVMDKASTPEQIQAALAAVDAFGDARCSKAIRMTLGYEQHRH